MKTLTIYYTSKPTIAKCYYVIVIHIICLNLSDNKIYIKSDENIKLLAEMEEQFENKNEQYFKNFLNHNNNIIRTRAVCILSDIARENAVEPISQVLKNDKDVLVRHEAAFSLGQLGYTSAIKALSKSVKSDPSFFVRHEAAIALGVIGSEKARKVLNQALNDESAEVRGSAIIALANIDYMSTMKRNNKFTRMTGG